MIYTPSCCCDESKDLIFQIFSMLYRAKTYSLQKCTHPLISDKHLVAVLVPAVGLHWDQGPRDLADLVQDRRRHGFQSRLHA